jgi:hypothetical protein
MAGTEEMRSSLYGDEIGRLGVLEELDVLSGVSDGVDGVFRALLRTLVMGWPTHLVYSHHYGKRQQKRRGTRK